MNRKSPKSRKIRKISLVLGIAVAALSVGAPTALAEGRMAGSSESDGLAFFKANEISTLTQQGVSTLGSYVDAGERSSTVQGGQELRALKLRSEGMNRIYGLGEFQPQEIKALHARSEALNRQYGLGAYATTAGSSTYRESGQRAVPQPTSPGNSPITTGNDFEWPPVGIGLLIGLFLVLGIGLAVRKTHIRPAH